jgi:transposase
MYPQGKSRLSWGEMRAIQQVLRVKSEKTVQSYVRFYEEKGWLRFNKRTGYYIIKSFEGIREENDWRMRNAILLLPLDLYRLKAFVGAGIYAYLHSVYLKRQREKESVQKKGRTYHFLQSCQNRKTAAPVSVNGVEKIFKISKAIASRLKKAAEKEKLIKVKKNYSRPISKKTMQCCLKYSDLPQKIVFRRRRYRLQLTDTITPLFSFTRRQKMKTL